MAMPRSLLEISVKFLFENFDRYDKAELSRLLAPFELIREMLLEHFRQASHDGANEMNRLWAALPLLIRSAKCKKINMLPFCGANRYRAPVLPNFLFQEFIHCLPSNTPNLEILEIFSPHPSRMTNPNIGRREALSIIRLTHLTKLEIIDNAIDMSGFMEILQKCKNLNEVVAKSINVDVAPCSQLISENFNRQRIVLDHRVHRDMLWELKKTEEKRLIYFLISSCKSKKMHLLRKLTHITHLEVNLEDAEGELCQLPFYPRLERVSLPCITMAGSKVAGIFLERNGRTLRELYMYGVPPGQISVGQLFQWCPNLVELYLMDALLIESEVPVQHLHRLQKVVYMSRDRSVDGCTFLFNPLMRKICFDTIESRVSDNWDDDVVYENIAQRRMS